MLHMYIHVNSFIMPGCMLFLISTFQQSGSSNETLTGEDGNTKASDSEVVRLLIGKSIEVVLRSLYHKY